MRTIAAIPAVALVAGAAVGLLTREPPYVLIYILLSTSVAGAMFAWAQRRPLWLALSVALAFSAGGVLLASVEWQRASRPPLRTAFERLASEARVDAARDNRRLPEDDEAFAIVEGILRADAAPSANGVSLSVAVEHVVNPSNLVNPSNRVNPTQPTHPANATDPTNATDATRATDPTHATHPTYPAQPALATPGAGGVVVTVVGSLAPARMHEWRAGRRLRFPVQLHRAARYLDAGVPDFERALARRGTTLVGTVKSGGLVEVVARASRLDEILAACRDFARKAIANAVGRWSPLSAAITAAIVIGDRAGLPDAVERRLQEAGTYHVIAISGGNIAILAGLLIGLFRVAGRLGRTAMLASIAALVVYARLVGGGASVTRATVMAVIYLAARAIDQRSPPLNALAVAAALLAAADPLSVADPAFVLTCGATLAILAVLPSASAGDRRLWPAVGAAVRAMFAASLAAELMLFPVGALAFSRVTVAGLALNFLAIPLMAITQIAGMAAVPAALVSPGAASAIGWIAHAGASGLVWSADLVAFAPLSTWRVAPPHWTLVALYYSAALTCWLLRWRRAAGVASQERRSARISRRLAFGVAAAAAAWIVANPLALLATRGDGALHLSFLDVGQGDSIFVGFPQGRTMLVDAGGLSGAGTFDIGDRVVAPVIRRAGFRRLDYLVLTHGDPDHIGGAAAVVEEFRPREIWEGIPVPRFEPLTALRTAAQAAGARWANVYTNSRVVIDGVELIARHPAAADWERQKVRNDDSLVLELRWREVSVLLTGDIGRAVEGEIAAAIPSARLRVVKIPHHGSLTSSTPEFIEALRPQIAIVSAGRANHFGHPVPDVLDRYRAAGAAVFRTDRDGEVKVDTDGHAISVATFTGRRLSLR